MDYFDQVVKRLTLQDFELLTLLAIDSSMIPLRAKNKQEIVEKTNFSEATYRKIINRLETLCFIESIGEGKAYAYYLTEYGKQAFEQLSTQVNN